VQTVKITIHRDVLMGKFDVLLASCRKLCRQRLVGHVKDGRVGTPSQSRPWVVLKRATELWRVVSI